MLAWMLLFFANFVGILSILDDRCVTTKDQQQKQKGNDTFINHFRISLTVRQIKDVLTVFP